MYRGMVTEMVSYEGHGGDAVEAYLARPTDDGSYGSVVVLHHMPGWDEGSIEITRKLAHHGFVAICPNLYTREGPGEIDEVAAVARAAGGVPDDRVVGDVAGAAAYLRGLPQANGRVGVIGFCSGGRQSFLVACRLDVLDAAVDCWGGRVVAPPDQLTERQPVAPIDLTGDLSCPLLGIFGADDRSPSPEQVEEHRRALERHGKEHEFHTYEGAGHGFFAVDRPAYRPEQATEAWKVVLEFLGRHLATS